MIYLVRVLIASVLALCIIFMWCASIFVIKHSKWEGELSGYKINDDGTVTNKQGVKINTAKWLLEELQGVEEKIAK